MPFKSEIICKLTSIAGKVGSFINRSLLWDRDDTPFVGVDLSGLGDNENYLLKKGDEIIGHLTIDAPEGAVGQMLVSNGPSQEEPTPVFGAPSMTAHWVGKFTAGSKPGL